MRAVAGCARALRAAAAGASHAAGAGGAVASAEVGGGLHARCGGWGGPAPLQTLAAAALRVGGGGLASVAACAAPQPQLQLRAALCTSAAAWRGWACGGALGSTGGRLLAPAQAALHSAGGAAPPLRGASSPPASLLLARGYAKQKMKNLSSFKERFKVTGTGKILRMHVGKRHCAWAKSRQQRTRLRKKGLVSYGLAKTMHKLGFKFAGSGR